MNPADVFKIFRAACDKSATAFVRRDTVTTWTTAGVRYLGVTHAVLITLQIDRVQDDLGGLLRLARLFHGIGAQNFVSAFVADRVVKCFAVSVDLMAVHIGI